MDHKSPREKELISKGWTRCFSASEPRLSEAVENYRQLGCEVILEPVDLCPGDDSCTSCLEQNPEWVRVIYTRGRKAAENDLF